MIISTFEEKNPQKADLCPCSNKNIMRAMTDDDDKKRPQPEERTKEEHIICLAHMLHKLNNGSRHPLNRDEQEYVLSILRPSRAAMNNYIKKPR